MRSKNKILIVDDDRTTITVLQEYLNGSGFQVRLAFSGSQALAALKKQKYDILIIDFKLPDIDGVQVVEQYFATSSSTAFVFLTGMKKAQIDARIDRRIQYTVIGKPCRPAELLRYLKKLR
jgi:two-component system response regulator HydG